MADIRKVKLNSGIGGVLFLHHMPARDDTDYGETYEQFVRKLDRHNVSTIVCLASTDEIDKKSSRYAAAIASGAVPRPIILSPIVDYKAPRDMDVFKTAVDVVVSLLKVGHRVLVHCGAGRGRTGVFSCCVLSALGYGRVEALRIIRDAGSGPENEEQERFVQEF